MTVQHIEKLKREYTDKYVEVADDQPAFSRFKGLVGQVKTVNMGGRALVEFLDYHLNTGWYDIDVDYLKVVDKPKPKEKAPAKKPAPKKPAAKKAPAGEKKLSPLEMARAGDSKKKEQAAGSKTGKPAAKPAGGKQSTTDILAAARGKKSAAPSKTVDKEKPAAPAGKAATPAADGTLDRSKMSVADMLAAARGDKAGGAAAAPANEDTPDDVEMAVQPPTEEEPTNETPAASSDASGPVDKSAMSIDDMLAWCREHDG